MLIQKPPKAMLVDTMTYYSYEGEGDYNKPKYADGKTVSFVRIDRKSQYKASLSGKELLGNAKIFCYQDLTTPLPMFKEQDKVMFDGKEHVVTSADMFKEPYRDKIYSWELVVV